MKALLERSGPISRLPFFLIGVALFGVKFAVDYGVALAFGQPYSIVYYVSPMDAPVMHPEGREIFWLTMWVVAVPFITVGVWLTLRRLRDARLPYWLVVFFFVPFANLLFFLATAAVPSRDPLPPTGEPVPPQEASRGVVTAMLMGGVVGAVVALGMVGVSVGLLGEYGASLFLGAPTVSCFAATLVFCRLNEPKVTGSLGAALLALLVSCGVMIAFAIEGIVCLIMAMPIAILAGFAGWLLAFVFARVARDAAPKTAPAVFAILPFWILGEIFNPLPREPDRVVESVIEIDAPPEVVWRRVLAFEELPAPTELIFRMGVSAPTGAVIEGEGVGAVRRCQFTTGEFVEPITVWDEPNELAFDVRRMPDPMREMTPYAGPRPPHLDGYFATTRGQFLLEELPGGRTRLHGKTWYTLEVFPRTYWSFWADDFIHRIHLRVMHQIERLAEEDQRALAGSRPPPAPTDAFAVSR